MTEATPFQNPDKACTCVVCGKRVTGRYEVGAIINTVEKTLVYCLEHKPDVAEE